MVARAVLAASLLLLAACGRSPAVAPATAAVPPIPVRVCPVVSSTRAIPVRAPAVLARRAEAQLAFKVGGIVREVTVRAGDRVAAGQVLASLDLQESDAQLAQARSAVEKARRDRDRAAELRARGAVSTEIAQDAATGLEQAVAALHIAEFNRRHAVIVAPAAGRILRRLVEPEENAAPGRVALLFASDDAGWIARAGLPESDAARLRIGDTALVGAPGQPPLPGELAQIYEEADPATRTIEIEVVLASAPPAGRSGSVVELELQPGDVPARPMVPITALVEGDGRTAHVFLAAADGRSVQRGKVTVHAVFAGQAYLASALPAGARVVVTGAELLRDGAAVEIVP